MLLAKLAEPLYVALKVWLPLGSVVGPSTQLATEAGSRATELQPLMGVDPDMKSTVPVGEPLALVTDADSVKPVP